MDSIFSTLNSINVNGHTENKNGLTYLSWAWAWAEVCKAYPGANYKVWKDENNRPYVYDPNLGYMVYTSVSIEGNTKEMWLPVMDSANYAMKAEPYTVKTRYKDVEVKAATMMDINKTIMRCLTKNLSMFGLGLYIYAGEDLPESEAEEKKEAPKQEAPKPVPVLVKPEAPAQPEIICERCQKPITAQVDKKSGDTVPGIAIAEYSKRRFGGACYCAKCQAAVIMAAKQ